MTTLMKSASNGDVAIPLPPKATVPLFYRYSSLTTPENVERLRAIIQEHELYLPSLDQLNDPADGRPRLAPLSEEQMSSFLYTKLVQRSPHLSPAELARETRNYFIQRQAAWDGSAAPNSHGIPPFGVGGLPRLFNVEALRQPKPLGQICRGPLRLLSGVCPRGITVRHREGRDVRGLPQDGC